jgi:type IX secretion system PorP/SprF family membrane protein
MIKKLPILCIVLCIALNLRAQQDPHFTQFYANKLYLAPSFAGATQQDRVSMIYRNQWPSMPGTFVTYGFSYDHFFDNFNSGVGLLFMRDVAGSGKLSTTNLGLQYSYDIKIADYWHVRPGIHFFYTQTGLDFNRLLWNDQLTSPGSSNGSIEPPSLDRTGDIDFSTSVLTYSDRHWFGFSLDHLLRPKNSLYETNQYIPIKVAVFGGTQVIRKGRLLSPIDESLSLTFLYKNHYNINQLDLGVYWYKNPLVLGVFYRGLPLINNEGRGDAIAFLTGYKIDNFSVGYSYDFTISRLLATTGGAHEISLTYEFKSTRQRKKRRMLPCPEF